jgi:hypothetical protein
MLDANVGKHKIEKLKNNMVELYDIKGKEENEMSNIDTLVFSPYFLYRHYSLYEIFDLYNWMSTFYSIDDFQFEIMYSSYKSKLFENYDKIYFRDRDDVFVKVKEGFAKRIIDMRATKNVFSDEDYNSDNFDEVNEKHKKILWDKYKDLIGCKPS